jgi:ketosteroid isomerase-like protein
VASAAAELVRATLEAFNRHDVDAALATVSEDAELYPLRAQLEGRTYWGREGLAESMAAAYADWDDVHLEIEEIRDLADGSVALVRFQARGHASGVDIDVPTAYHFRVSDGKITYLRAYPNPADAQRAAGADSASD